MRPSHGETGTSKSRNPSSVGSKYTYLLSRKHFSVYSRPPMSPIQIFPIHLRSSPDMSSPLPPYKQIYFTLKHNPIKTTEVSTFNNYHSVLSLTFRKLTITNKVNHEIRPLRTQLGGLPRWRTTRIRKGREEYVWGRPFLKRGRRFKKILRRPAEACSGSDFG